MEGVQLCLLHDEHTFAPLVVGRRVSFDCRTCVQFTLCFQSRHLHLTALSTPLRWLKHLRAAKRCTSLHVWFNMVAEQPLGAVTGVIRRRSEKERRCDDEDEYAVWEILRGYCEADGEVREVTGRCWWSDDDDRMGIYIEPDGLNDEARDKFGMKSDETYVSIEIATVDGKRKTFLLTGLASETTGFEVAQDERKQVIDETMVFVGVDDVGEKFDDSERMTARFGEKGITEDCCDRGDESAQGFQVYVEDFGDPRVETNGAGLLIEDEGMKIDTSDYVAKEKHRRSSRGETCSPHVNKSCFGFWNRPGVDPDFDESGMDEFANSMRVRRRCLRCQHTNREPRTEV